MIHSYPWYMGDWRNSETRVNLTLEERGLYRELLDFCYIERSLPVDERKLARIVNCSDEEFLRSWPNVQKLFERVNERYFHRKVTEVLNKLDGYAEQRRQAGVASGERRRNARSSTVEFSLPKNPTKNEPTNPTNPTQPNPTEETPPNPPISPYQPECASTDAPADGFSLIPVSDSAVQIRESSLHSNQVGWFESWWAIYWRKVSRKPAEKAFFAHVKTQDRFERVMLATRAQNPAMMAREPDHRPHGASWLNAERWNDQPSMPAQRAPGSNGKVSVDQLAESIGAFRRTR